MTARNMYRIEINIQKKDLFVKLVIYKEYTELHGQQNIKNVPVFTCIYDSLHNSVSGQLIMCVKRDSCVNHVRTSTVVSEDNSICLIVNIEFRSVERKINVQAKIIFF
jgi:hypothetical protein